MSLLPDEPTFPDETSPWAIFYQRLLHETALIVDADSYMEVPYYVQRLKDALRARLDAEQAP